ncbi:MAG: PEGA domain-containing protein [Candidatus Aminicenantes bacterium]|nr:MAG: PEGA domain-containing protein [Candidatus Aminicenantes bacterium]
MLRIARFPLIVLIMSFVFFQAFSQEENPLKVKVIVDSATVKVTPEIDGETLARIPLDTTLEAVEKQGEWYKVTFDKEGLQITGFIHEMLVREMSEDEVAEEGASTQTGTVESQAEIIREIEIRMDESRQLIRQKDKFKEAIISLSPLIAKTFRIEDIQKQRQLATEIFLWTGMAYSGIGDAYAALRELRNMFEVDHAYGKAITRNIYDPAIGGLIEQAEKEYLGIIKNYSLRLTTQPEQARITINDEYIGATPLIYRSESPKVVLEVTKEGYKSMEDDLFLSQENTDKEYVLERLGRNLDVKSIPQGANIFIDDEDTGQLTDGVLPYVSFGTHKLRISRENYADWEEMIEVPVGENPISVDVILAAKVYVPLRKWGSPDSPFFKQPTGLTLDKDGIVYVVDNSQDKIKKITPEGKIDRSWISGGEDFNKNVKSPGGIAIDSQGYMYVTDTKKHAVLKFDQNGKFILKWGKEGSANSEFRTPLGIAVDGENNIYVADSTNHCVKIFSNLGVFKKTIGRRGTEEGDFLFPAAIAINQKKELLVLDRSRLQKFSSGGELLLSWGKGGSGDGDLNKPMGIFIDKDEFVYVADSGNNRIQKFDGKGQFVSKWGGVGDGDGQMSFPSGIIVDSRGTVYVAETGNNRIQSFKVSSDVANE